MDVRVVASLLATAAALAVVSGCDAGPESDVDDFAELLEEQLEEEDAADDAERGEVGDARAAIVGGHAESGRPAVVAIVMASTDASQEDVLVCSGVLITPTIVVTAAHCLHPHVTGIAAEELVVVFGESVAGGTTRVDVLTGAYHPGWHVDDPEGGNDIGALRLAQTAPVDPIPLGPGPAAGADVVLVGYGDTSDSANGAAGAGVKRSGDAVVGAMGDSWFRMDRSAVTATTCSGDSGGATLANMNGAEVLLGVHSRGDCETAVWDERVDVHADGFLKSFMGEFGGCGQDGACALNCPDPDPDCPCADDGMCNEACGDADADCAGEDTCQGEDDPSCACDGESCEAAAAPPAAGGWGSAGCSVAPGSVAPGSVAPGSVAPGSVAPGGAGVHTGAAFAALAGVLSLLRRASRRRAAHGGRSRSGS